jgi:hypothetical protein
MQYLGLHSKLKQHSETSIEMLGSKRYSEKKEFLKMA